MRYAIVVLVLTVIFSGAIRAEETEGYKVASPSRITGMPDMETNILNRRLETLRLTDQLITDAKYTAGLPGVLRRERRQKIEKISAPVRKREIPARMKRRKRKKRNLRRFYLLKKNE